LHVLVFFFFFQAEDGIRDFHVTGVQTCALPIFVWAAAWDMTRDGELPAREYLELILANVGAERDSTVLLVLLRQLSLTLRAYTRSEERRVGTEWSAQWWRQPQKK